MICQLPPPGIIAFDKVAYPYSDKPEGYMHKNIVVRYTVRLFFLSQVLSSSLVCSFDNICQLPPPGIIAFDKVACPYSD
jgi:hypothetical protein